MDKKTARSITDRAVLDTLGGSALDIEEHRLVVALQVNVEDVTRHALACFLPGDQRLAPLRIHDLVEHPVARVGLGLVREINDRQKLEAMEEHKAERWEQAEADKKKQEEEKAEDRREQLAEQTGEDD